MTVEYKLVQVPEDLHELLSTIAFVNKTKIRDEAEAALRIGLEQRTVPQVANVQQQVQSARVSA